MGERCWALATYEIPVEEAQAEHDDAGRFPDLRWLAVRR